MIEKYINNPDLNDETRKHIEREIDMEQNHVFEIGDASLPDLFTGFYEKTDFDIFYPESKFKPEYALYIKTLEELMEHDNQREKDGFPKRIRLGKIVKPVQGKQGQVIVIPSTYEPKFYHDNSITEDEEENGGSGDGEEGQVIGEQSADPQQGEGDGEGAGEGQGGDHDVTSEAFDLGKILTEQFQLPNIKEKGKKPSLTKFKYDLTDKNRGFGQLLDKKATMRKIIETNIVLGNIQEGKDFDPGDLIINPNDKIFRIMSREKDYESQAIVFFVRDYSGSMSGKPTEVITSQHLLIYSWLVYQFSNNVETKFILHDTEAREVPDFYTYYKYRVAGGTQVYPAFEMVNKIIEQENLANDYNIYVFYGTDGDDWENTGEKMLIELNKLLNVANRVGITVAKNAWTSMNTHTTVEKYIEQSGLLKSRKDVLRMDKIDSKSSTDEILIESIKKLISE